MAEQQPTVHGIARAAQSLREFFPRTPLVRAPILSDQLACDLWVKNETVSPVASFKWRGALNALRAARSAAGVVTASTGNHGQGVAWSASVSGVPSRIFLPNVTPEVKRSKIALFGAKIEGVDGDLEAARTAAMAFGDREHIPFIDDGESVEVIEGAGTIGLEIAEQLPEVDVVFVPMGSGSLAGGIALALKSRQPNARVIAVQSSAGSAMADSFRARRAVERPSSTLAEGLHCSVPARLALETVLAHVDDVALVSDDDAFSAVAMFIAKAQLLVEVSAAVGLAAALQAGKTIAGKRVVIIATGANITTTVLQQALSSARVDAR